MKEKYYLLTEEELKYIIATSFGDGRLNRDINMKMPEPITVPDEKEIVNAGTNKVDGEFKSIESFEKGANWAISQILKTKRK